MWEQMDRHGPDLELPMYGGRYRPRPQGANNRQPQEVRTQ
jgi:hypothetical protein